MDSNSDGFFLDSRVSIWTLRVSFWTCGFLIGFCGILCGLCGCLFGLCGFLTNFFSDSAGWFVLSAVFCVARPGSRGTGPGIRHARQPARRHGHRRFSLQSRRDFHNPRFLMCAGSKFVETQKIFHCPALSAKLLVWGRRNSDSEQKRARHRSGVTKGGF